MPKRARPTPLPGRKAGAGPSEASAAAPRRPACFEGAGAILRWKAARAEGWLAEVEGVGSSLGAAATTGRRAASGSG